MPVTLHVGVIRQLVAAITRREEVRVSCAPSLRLLRTTPPSLNPCGTHE